MRVPQFPERTEYAKALFKEAIRHLTDAHALHQSGRWAGSVTSALKAVELALKSIVTLDGGAGWLPQLYKTHAVYTGLIAKYPVLRAHAVEIDGIDPGLPSGLRLIERLIPEAQDASNVDMSKAANSEYPFIADDGAVVKLFAPGDQFVAVDSAAHYQTARMLISGLKSRYRAINTSGLRVPPMI